MDSSRRTTAYCNYTNSGDCSNIKYSMATEYRGEQKKYDYGFKILKRIAILLEVLAILNPL